MRLPVFSREPMTVPQGHKKGVMHMGTVGSGYYYILTPSDPSQLVFAGRPHQTHFPRQDCLTIIAIFVVWLSHWKTCNELVQRQRCQLARSARERPWSQPGWGCIDFIRQLTSRQPK
jgi:hypothetical protein